MYTSAHFGLLARFVLPALIAGAGIFAPGCTRAPQTTGAYQASSKGDCLPDITLTNQYGKPVSLASLKGKPVFFDFIYTTCPGPCLMLTSRMRLIANRLGPALGSKVRLVSITVDPEHDHPAQLLDYARQQGADQNGWLFLTGTPAQIDQVMSQFRLVRQREDDGTVDHVLEFFLVGADGKQLYQYAASHADLATVTRDIEEAERSGTVTGMGEEPFKAHL
jgi:cytochrome oxidase Cu insertion factor (SCO1/SenC/PrrC family)